MKKRLGMIVALAALAGMIAVMITVKPPEREADVVCPMANANISWDQTHYEGAWSSAGRR